MKTKGTNKDIKLAQRLLKLSEEKARAAKATEISEGGTPTTALPPSTNATRQLQSDMAKVGKEGVPSGIGAPDPSDQQPVNAADKDINGEDSPADIKANYAKKGETQGMQIPADIKPSPAGPATDTTAPGTDDSAQLASDVAKAKQKSGTGRRLGEMKAEDIVAALIEHYGSPEDLVFKLVAEGASFELAEAIVEGEIDLDGDIEGRIREIAESVLEPVDEAAELVASLEGDDAANLIKHLVAEGFGDAIKRGIEKIRGGSSRPAPSAGYLKSKAGHLDRQRDKSQGSNRVLTTQKRSWGTSSEAHKSFRREGPTARANK